MYLSSTSLQHETGDGSSVQTDMIIRALSIRGCSLLPRAVLVAIAIPIFTSQLEKSREATDEANLRSLYAETTAAVLGEDTNASTSIKDATLTVVKGTDGVYTGTAEYTCQQQKAGLESNQNVNIGGVEVDKTKFGAFCVSDRPLMRSERPGISTDQSRQGQGLCRLLRSPLDPPNKLKWVAYRQIDESICYTPMSDSGGWPLSNADWPFTSAKPAVGLRQMQFGPSSKITITIKSDGSAPTIL